MDAPDGRAAREHDRIETEIGRTGRSSDPFASAVRATRMPMLITDPNQPDNPIIFSNDAFAKLTGYTREEILGRNCRFLQGPETDCADVDKIRRAIELRVPIEIELLNHKKDGEVFWNRLLISPVFDQDGALTYYFASQFDVTLERDRLVRLQTDRDALEREIQQRTMDLRRSEDSLRFILKAGGFGSWTLDLADRRLVASALCKQNFGRSTDEPFTYDDLFAAIVPEDRARMQAAVKSAIDDQHEYNITYRIETPARELRWIEIRGQAHYHADGTPLSMVGISADVTERKRGEEHRALLAAELNHRVKNSMATMQSIAYQTLRNAATLDGAREDLEARIQSLAAAHDVLTRESWEGAMLDEIVAGALAPFRVGEVDRFKVGGPSIRLKPRLTLAISLALHELATNAVKYGALSNDSGHVLVSWAKETNQSVPRFSLRWEEVGGPTVEPPSRQGFGTRMIERALVSELKGSAQIDYRPRGVVFTLDAPIFSADDM